MSTTDHKIVIISTVALDRKRTVDPTNPNNTDIWFLGYGLGAPDDIFNWVADPPIDILHFLTKDGTTILPAEINFAEMKQQSNRYHIDTIHEIQIANPELTNIIKQAIQTYITSK